MNNFNSSLITILLSLNYRNNLYILYILYLILPAKFVDPDIGTGVVTSVPGDAPYDYVALRELQEFKDLDKRCGFSVDQIKDIENIEIIPIIKTEKYGDKAGVKVVHDMDVKFQDDKRLKKLTQDVYKEGYHSGILLDICGPYAGMKVAEAKEKMKKDLIAKGGADIMYETSRKAISRSGGKIIVAVLSGQWFLDFNAPGWKDLAYKCLKQIELLPEEKRKGFEDTFEWLDKRPCARRRGLGTPLPFDKNWIIESLSDSTIYMTLYAINNIIRKNKLKRKNLGREFFDYVYLGKGDLKDISKKTGVGGGVLKELRESFEYWMPNDHRHTFELHLSNHLSFMIFAHAGLFPKKYWPKKISFHGLVVSEGTKMSKSKGNLITLLHVKEIYGADTFRFYMTKSSNIDGTFDWREEEAESSRRAVERLALQMKECVKKKKSGKYGKIKPIFVSRFNKIIKEASEKIDSMKLREYDNAVVYDMLSLVKDAKNSMSKDELGVFYDMIIADWIKLVSPVCPHIAEEFWKKIGSKGFVSKAAWPAADESKIDEKLEEAERAVDNTVSDIVNVLKIVREKSGKEPEKVFLYIIPKELESYNAERLGKRLGKLVLVFANNDKKKYDPQGKAGKAKPGKPAIYVE